MSDADKNALAEAVAENERLNDVCDELIRVAENAGAAIDRLEARLAELDPLGVDCSVDRIGDPDRVTVIDETVIRLDGDAFAKTVLRGLRPKISLAFYEGGGSVAIKTDGSGLMLTLKPGGSPVDKPTWGQRSLSIVHNPED